MVKKLYLLFILVIFLSGCSKIEAPPAAHDKLCGEDSDCIIVGKIDPKNSCCTTCDVESVYKESEVYRQEWFLNNCLDAKCPTYDCYDEQIPVAICKEGICSIQCNDR